MIKQTSAGVGLRPKFQRMCPKRCGLYPHLKSTQGCIDVIAKQINAVYGPERLRGLGAVQMRQSVVWFGISQEIVSSVPDKQTMSLDFT